MFCRVPTVCVSRLESNGVPVEKHVLDALLSYCFRSRKNIKPLPVFRFDERFQLALPEGQKPSKWEGVLLAWALEPTIDLSWLRALGIVPSAATAVPVPQASVAASATSAVSAEQVVASDAPLTFASGEQIYDFAWRAVQEEMLSKLALMQKGSIALLEASTGSGKTRVAGHWALSNSSQVPILIAVPTVVIASQWVAELAQMDRNIDVQPVLGQEWYELPRQQEQAIADAMHAPIVICTQHMLLRLAGLCKWRLIVDEAHMLHTAISATAGRFLPIASMGESFRNWCVSKLGLIEGQAMEVPLNGRMRDAVFKRMGIDKPKARSQVCVVMQAEGGMGVVVKDPATLKNALAGLWTSCESALLLSATQSSRTAAGVRSTRIFSRRLGLDDGRLQDLGGVRSAWRDAGVIVQRCEREKGADGRIWLAPHSDRKDQWYREVAQTMLEWSRLRLKTLMLATSYADVEGIGLAAKELGVRGVFAPERGVSMQDQKLTFAADSVWCWVATGSAWTGMDLPVPIRRLAVTRLPLLNPEGDEEGALPEEVLFDSVSRFRQGAGRMVRSEEAGDSKWLVLMDGRINEASPWWRSLCQPYLQVLSEDYEEHEVFSLPEVG